MIKVPVHEHERTIFLFTLSLMETFETKQVEAGFAIRISGKLSLRSNRLSLSDHYRA